MQTTKQPIAAEKKEIGRKFGHRSLMENDKDVSNKNSVVAACYCNCGCACYVKG